ncbi:MAG: hypothetical protein AB7O62_08580 [Pirellulales bacterium]
MKRMLLRLLGRADLADLTRANDRLGRELGQARRDLATVQAELADALADLARTRNDLDEARVGLRVAQAENLGAWKLIERFHAQWDADVATIGRRMADAETDRRLIEAEAVEEAPV